MKVINNNKLKDPIILFDCETLELMKAIVKECTTECQWHLSVQRNKNIFKLYNLQMFPQENSGATTDTDTDEYIEWLTNIPNDEINLLRCHGHSHVNMSVYSSSTDTKYQEDIISKLEPNDFYIFLVVNKSNNIHIRLYDLKNNIMFEDNDIQIFTLNKDNETFVKKAKELIKENCKEKKKCTQSSWENEKWFNLKTMSSKK